MKRWIARNALTQDFGYVLPWVAVVTGGAIQAVATAWHMLSLIGAGNEPVIVLNLWLTLWLGLAYSVWIGFVARQKVTPSTGNGFVLAGFALAARAFTELLRATLGWEQWIALGPSTGAADMVTAVRVLGLAAYAAGLATVLMACLAERRYDPRVPTPLGLARGKRERRPEAKHVSDVFR